MIAPSDRAASVEEYLGLRRAAGMGDFPAENAAIALSATLHGVWFRDPEARLRAMGRLIGGGGCFAQITDIAVDPDYQRQGWGTKVMQTLMTWAERELPRRCYVSLIADPGAERLYEKFGFGLRTGMARYL